MRIKGEVPGGIFPIRDVKFPIIINRSIFKTVKQAEGRAGWFSIPAQVPPGMHLLIHSWAVLAQGEPH